MLSTARIRCAYGEARVWSRGQLPHLPKMRNASAIVDTLVDGCVAGDFVLQLRRPDKSLRTWWRTRPDEEALKDVDMEVVLSTAAELGEIPGALLRKGVLPGLWETKTELSVSEVRRTSRGARASRWTGEDITRASKCRRREPRW